MKILVLGANGMAGHMVTKVLRSNGRDVTTLARSVVKDPIDVILDVETDLDKLFEIVKDYDVVINCIGLLVEESRRSLKKAALINGTLPVLLAAQAKRLIHISTDCVFNGLGAGWYTPADPPNETNNYGRTKTYGELAGIKGLVLRTSIIGPEISNHKTGLLEWVLSSKEECKGYINHLWNGITTLELSNLIDSQLDRDNIGIMQIGTTEPITKYRLVETICDVYNHNRPITATYTTTSINKTLRPDIFAKPIRIQLEELRDVRR